MTTERTVWTMGDAYVNIYLEDSSGNLTGTSQVPNQTEPFAVAPIIRYCFIESVSISAKTPIARRAVTGRNRRKLTAPAGMYDDISATIEHMLFKKADEFNLAIFNSRQNLRIQFLLYKLEYSNSPDQSNDPFYLRFARAQSFDITGRMPDTITANASFLAELIE